MRPVKFVLALSLGIVFFFFALKLLFIAFISIAGVALIFMALKGIAHFALAARSGCQRSAFPTRDKYSSKQWGQAAIISIDPYLDSSEREPFSARTIEVL